jgi:hypothetical protein
MSAKWAEMYLRTGMIDNAAVARRKIRDRIILNSRHRGRKYSCRAKRAGIAGRRDPAIEAPAAGGVRTGACIRYSKAPIRPTFPFYLPNRFQLIVNLKAAKTIGIELAPTLVASADEVIE